MCFFLALPHGCTGPNAGQAQRLKYHAANGSPEVLAVYEAWFGHPNHIHIDYSSHDSAFLAQQMRRARSLGISGFVVDWYGDREPFIDQSYALMQSQAEKNKFKIAMMYDETDQEDGATDEAIADFTMFHDTYLASNSPGHQAYLTYEGRPVIFIFPKGRHTDWDKVRAVVDKWNPAPLLIQENLPSGDAKDFDGYYAWVDPKQGGNGGDWGEDYLKNFYQTMLDKYPDKIVVGGMWAMFNDAKASWGLNRHIDARCGQTLVDTYNMWQKILTPENTPPFLLVETWNDYEEGTAVEQGIPSCTPGGQLQPVVLPKPTPAQPPQQKQ